MDVEREEELRTALRDKERDHRVDPRYRLQRSWAPLYTWSPDRQRKSAQVQLLSLLVQTLRRVEVYLGLHVGSFVACTVESLTGVWWLRA